MAPVPTLVPLDSVADVKNGRELVILTDPPVVVAGGGVGWVVSRADRAALVWSRGGGTDTTFRCLVRCVAIPLVTVEVGGGGWVGG